MNPMLKKAHELGAAQAEQDFQKEAQGYYDQLPPELMMQLMENPYGQAVQQGAEQAPDTAEKIRTGLRSVGGGITGGLGGAAVGGALGYGGGHLAKLLGADVDEEDIRKAMIYSALLGGGLGAGAGGVGGGVLGQQ